MAMLVKRKCQARNELHKNMHFNSRNIFCKFRKADIKNRLLQKQTLTFVLGNNKIRIEIQFNLDLLNMGLSDSPIFQIISFVPWNYFLNSFTLDFSYIFYNISSGCFRS